MQFKPEHHENALSKTAAASDHPFTCNDRDTTKLIEQLGLACSEQQQQALGRH